LLDQYAGPALVSAGRHQEKAGKIKKSRALGTRREEREHNAKSKTAAFEGTHFESPRA
jgi:hypothetical protein